MAASMSSLWMPTCRSGKRQQWQHRHQLSSEPVAIMGASCSELHLLAFLAWQRLGALTGLCGLPCLLQPVHEAQHVPLPMPATLASC
jgi:hypothetical protein